MDTFAKLLNYQNIKISKLNDIKFAQHETELLPENYCSKSSSILEQKKYTFFTPLARRLDDHFPPGSIGSFLPAQPALHSIGLSFFLCQHFFGFYFFIEVNIYLISYSSRLTRCIFFYAACMTPVSNSVTQDHKFATNGIQRALQFLELGKPLLCFSSFILQRINYYFC